MSALPEYTQNHLRSREAMSLEYVCGIAFPKYLAPFFYQILREIPACTITMHTHLSLSATHHVHIYFATHRLNQPHDKPPYRPRLIASRPSVPVSAYCYSELLEEVDSLTNVNGPLSAVKSVRHDEADDTNTYQGLYSSNSVIGKEVSFYQC